MQHRRHPTHTTSNTHIPSKQQTETTLEKMSLQQLNAQSEKVLVERGIDPLAPHLKHQTPISSVESVNKFSTLNFTENNLQLTQVPAEVENDDSGTRMRAQVVLKAAERMQETTVGAMNKFSSLSFTANNPKLPSSPIEEDLDENGIRRRVPLVPGPRTYSDVARKGEECLIFSTSITKGIKVNEFNDNYDGGTASFRRFHGGRVRHIKEYLWTHLEERQPKTVIIHAGGNDLPTPKGEQPIPVGDIANDVMEAGIICRRYGVRDIFISSVTLRKQMYVQRRCQELNDFLRELCKLHGFIYLDNSNIKLEHLFDGTHLNHEGSVILANNYLYYLNSVYWDVTVKQT